MKFRTKYISTFSIILIVLFYKNIGFSQQPLKYDLAPLPFKVDKLEVTNSHNVGADIFVFRVNNLEGIVDSKGKILLPAEFEQAVVVDTGRYYQQIINQTTLYFDRMGNKYTYEQFEKKRNRTSQKFDCGNFERLKLPVTCQELSKEKLIIRTTNGKITDTIRNVAYNNYVASYAPGTFKVANATYFVETGKIFREVKNSIQTLTDKYMTVAEGKDKRMLLDYNLKNVFGDYKPDIELYKKTNFIVVDDKANNKRQIYNDKVELIAEGNFGYAYEFPPYFHFENKDGNVKSYNIVTKQLAELPFKSFAHINQTKYAKVTKDSLVELFDLSKSEIVIKPETKHIYNVGNYFVATNVNRYKTKGPFPIKIYNHKFEKIKELSAIEFQNLGSYLFVKIGKADVMIIDSTGNIVKQGEYWIGTHSFVSLVRGGKSFLTPYDNFFGPNKPEMYFSGIQGDIITTETSKKAIVVAEKEGVYGIISTKGELLVPFKFQSIELSISSKSQCVVNYNSNLGILNISNL